MHQWAQTLTIPYGQRPPMKLIDAVRALGRAHRAQQREDARAAGKTHVPAAFVRAHGMVVSLPEEELAPEVG